MSSREFTSRSVEGAIALAKRALGEDALVLEVRRTSAGFTVICGVVEELVSEQNALINGVDDGIAELQSRIEHMQLLLATGPKPDAALSTARTPQRTDVLGSLDLSPSLRSAILQEIASMRRGAAASDSEVAMRSAISALLPSEPATEQGPDRRSVIALCGSHGAGKTTALLKLAFHLKRAGCARLGAIGVDSGSLDSDALLRSVTDALGIPYKQVATAAEMRQAREECTAMDAVLIDTPGVSVNDASATHAIAEVVAAARPSEVHLVVNATMRLADALLVARACIPFRPTRLLVTHADEAHCLDAAASASYETGLPIAHLGEGVWIQDGLRVCTPADLTTLLTRHDAARSTAAA